MFCPLFITVSTEKAEVDADCYIGDFTVIEAGVKIGKNCQIYPQVYLGAGVTVGEGGISSRSGFCRNLPLIEALSHSSQA
ncbi:hypothetical protein [Alistipes indistinctus]|uniref:hypothetical protein n=1 Tax=Alistipes indistinctus TaxID=626932 RepID=UPI003AB7FC0D